MNILTVLMWKHWIVRKRTIISTIVEILYPLSLFLIVFLLRNKIFFPSSSTSSAGSQNERLTEPMKLDRRLSVQRVLYYPETKLTTQLMDLVGHQLRLPRLVNLPDHKTKGIYGLANLSIMEDRAKTMKDNVEAVVLFQNMTDEMPKKLNYTIRIKTNFMTHRYTSLDEKDFGPHEGFGSIYQPFLRLQWAIDSSYLSLRDQKPPQTVWIQEFPFVNSDLNPQASLICEVLKLLNWLSLLLPYVFFVSKLVAEKCSGTLELVKMVGVSWQCLTLSQFLNMLPTGLVFSIGATILLKASSTPLLAFTNGVVLFVYLFLYFFSILAVALFISYLTRTTRFAGSIAFLSFTLLWVLPMRVPASMPKAVALLSGLLPNKPLEWFWGQVEVIEIRGSSMTGNTFFKSLSAHGFSMFVCIVFLLLQIALYILLSWYLSHVCPGEHGVARPANFLFQKSFWSPQKVTPDAQDEDEDEAEAPIAEQKYFEPAPPAADVGIKITNVSKVFPEHKALSDVSIDVYKGEITVLLGHNGAGKTTLMSIITGMYSATRGSVLVRGRDARLGVRKHLGLCPQHNVYFPNLTVLEHVIFYTLLKGVPYSSAVDSSVSLLGRLGLQDKLSSKVSQLSGGMMRRAQLACALAGNASVLILDEPTSGLDVETRRELWDLLLSLRSSHTVLLSTHFMEEADALADRVVALHAGRVRCAASPMYLKRAIGTGYRLTFTTIGAPQAAAITQCIQKVVPEATVKEHLSNSITYSLPASSSGRFPELFGDLESRRSELAIDSIGLGASTLEEVFLRLCSDTETSFSNDELDGVPPPASTVKKLTGIRLYLRQLCVLFKRQLMYIYSMKMSFFILQVLLPIVLLIGTAYSTNAAALQEAEPNPPVAMDLRVFAGRADSRALLGGTVGGRVGRMREEYPTVHFRASPDVIDDVLNAGHSDLSEYNKYLVGVELNNTDAKISYTTIYRHAAPVALNMLSNSLAPPGGAGSAIVTYNHPVDGAFKKDNWPQPKDLALCVMWTVFTVFVTCATLTNAASLCVKERIAGSRHIHLMSGCPAPLHWGATVAFHTLLYAVTLVFPQVVIAAAVDTDQTFQDGGFLTSLAVSSILGTMGFLSMSYLASFYLGERGISVFLTAVSILFGFITPSTYMSVATMSASLPWYIRLLGCLRYLLPPHAYFCAVMYTTLVARKNAECRLVPFCNEPPKCFFCFEKDTPGADMVILFVQTIVYMILVLLKEYGILSKCYEAVVNRGYRPPAPRHADPQARGEKAYVDKAFNLPKEQIKESMLVRDLHKAYRSCFKKPVYAVRGISFAVKKGECFGLLGVNGAGKSTAFKMITAEESPTRGGILAGGHRLARSGPYLQSLGYCPQLFGLDGFLSGKQHLQLVLALRGLPALEADRQADTWIQIVGLEKYASRRISSYSGGMKRRSATASALSGGALALLDEPTAGVDVAARRRVWAAVRRALRDQRAVVITSHSMDEMEALCSRIAILSAGEVCALGSAAALKSQHAKGHALIIKLNRAANATEADFKTDVTKLKEKLHKTFNCRLVDEHKSMQHYHINDTMQYSVLFDQLEEIKHSFAVIEDYSVTETTLEEVFLSFAKDTPEEIGVSPV